MKRTILISATIVLGYTTLNTTAENTKFTNEMSLEITTKNTVEQQIKSYKILSPEVKEVSKQLYFWKAKSNYGKSKKWASRKAIAQKNDITSRKKRVNASKKTIKIG